MAIIIFVGRGRMTFILEKTVEILGMTTISIISMTAINKPTINSGYIMADLTLSANSISFCKFSLRSFKVTSNVPASSDAFTMLAATFEKTFGNFRKSKIYVFTLI